MSAKKLLRNVDPNRKKLTIILEKKSRTVLAKFRQETVLGISHPQSISILKDVNTYWKDLQRPSLTSFSCEAVGGQSSVAEEAGLMITLAAAGMGIHDDIIDKSESKHFKETILGRHGIDNALLVGDLLIIKGLTYSQKFLGETCEPRTKAAVLEALQNFIFEIYEGELMDVLCRQNLETEPEYYTKIIWKLTSDAEACARIGAILGGGSEDEIRSLAEFGRKLGFIIHLGEELRDLLNVEGNLPHRLVYESVPLPILYAAKHSKDAHEQIKSIIHGSDIAPHVSDLIKLCWKTKAVSYIYDLAKQNSKQAIQKLESLKPSIARDNLALMMKVSLTYIKRERYVENRYLRLLNSA